MLLKQLLASELQIGMWYPIFPT